MRYTSRSVTLGVCHPANLLPPSQWTCKERREPATFALPAKIHTMKYCIVFVFCVFLYCRSQSATIQRRSRLQPRGVSELTRRSASAIVSEGLAKGPYMRRLGWKRTHDPSHRATTPHGSIAGKELAQGS